VFGLDDKLAHLSDGTTLVVVLAVAILLGVRHASDPDHLTAVTTLVASGKERGARAAGRLGLAWGAGHGASLFAFGLPIVLYRAYLPEPVQRGAETAVGLVIVALAVRLLVRWRRGRLHAHAPRSAWQAGGIGVVHGTGGSAGVGVLLLAAIRSEPLAVVALALFASCTALSMGALSAGFGLTLERPAARLALVKIVPVLGAAALVFGAVYTAGAAA
jgi:hypothetical protein